jgi:cytochrome c biogenesis protein CcmG/thiol:disulfide interchange protein DsbE
VKRRTLGWILIAGAAIAALAVFGLRSDHSGGENHRAAALPRESLAGSPLTLDQLLEGARGRPALIVFWASWCEPCLREAPALERFYRGPIGRGRIVGVDWSDGLPGARSFIQRYGWTFPNLRDADGSVGNAYHLTGLPTTFVLDGGGRIRKILRGPQSDGDLVRALAAVERA